MSQWYYAHDNQQQGPVNEAELKEFLATGKLAPTTLVWKEGLANWAMANSLPEFQFRPPPMPSAPKATTPPVTPSPAATPTPETGTNPFVATPTGPLEPEDVNKNKPFAILAYLGILFIVPMLAAKDSPFAKYHTNQGLILFLVWIVGAIAVSIIGAFPFVGMISVILWPALSVVYFVLMIFGILNAAKGENKPLPYIGQYTIYS